MSWWLLAVLVLVCAALWIRWRINLRRDAMLQDSIDRLSSYTDEPKRPPAKQPWKRPGFGPPARISKANLGDGPLPPPAGDLEDPAVAGPIPDEDDGPALVPIDPSPEPEPEPEPEASAKPPPPPPPPGSPPDVDETREPAQSAASAADPSPLPDDPEEDVELAVVRGPRVLDLPPELAEEVRGLVQSHQEVAAVRLICDTMRVGILDAQRTVRSLAGR